MFSINELLLNKNLVFLARTYHLDIQSFNYVSSKNRIIIYFSKGINWKYGTSFKRPYRENFALDQR